MKSLNTVNIIHWLSIGSAAVLGAATVFTGDPKLGAYALAVISVSQVIHKFADAMENQATVTTAVAVSASVPTAVAAKLATGVVKL